MILGTYKGQLYRLLYINIPAMPYHSSLITIAPKDKDDDFGVTVEGWQFEKPYGTERPRGDFSRGSDIERLILNLI